ncbi:hypothetical protein [Thalassotalea agarivorans]|uniref:Uncharacterized protein n=1 Tax=Thalassotalea agarivorans TaxID=349064 RepID=A0A1I0ABU5_THASX|nr:hypothetical protein [Thalassotalea agarivorans]SES91670.1 hypothetical protein SAMN05660429_00651 [Thalassotalea agarivorans]
MLNRAAIIIKYKQPAVDWINDADPYDTPGISIESVNSESHVYLIDHDDAEVLDDWIKLNYEALFFDELMGWYTDESLWPKKRTLSLFKKWFHIECHTIILDTVGTPIVSEEI